MSFRRHPQVDHNQNLGAPSFDSEESILKFIESTKPKEFGDSVSEGICIKLAYALKSSKITLITKVEILKWMVRSHSYMETSRNFLILYEMFFGLLKSKEMRPYAAHFICLITQKKHVTFRRVRFLYKLVDEYDDLSCSSILRTYFFLSPECFEDEFKEEHLITFECFGASPSLLKGVHASEPMYNEWDPNNERPIITPFRKCEECHGNFPEIPASKLSSFHQLNKEFRALERSNNVLKILESRLKRFFLTSRLKKNIEIKVHDYIVSMLHRDFDSSDIVEKHLDLFRLQHSIPGITEFTEFLLLKDDCNPDIVEVMCYEPVSCFKKIEYKLQIIQGKILGTDDTEIKCRWLNFLSKMFCRWILESRTFISCDVMCSELYDDFDSSAESSPFHELSVELNKVGSEIDFLCDCLITEDSSPLALNQVLRHYNTVTIARQLNGSSFKLFFPSPAVFQISLFSLTPFILEFLCELLLRVKVVNETECLTINEQLMFQAACNDIKKVFLGGAYVHESTYLAKSDIFKKLMEGCSGYKNGFIIYKNPAFLLTIKEFDDKEFFESILINPESKQQFCNRLARNGSILFSKLILKIQ